jgi:hypothetical protein
MAEAFVAIHAIIKTLENRVRIIEEYSENE